MNTTTTILGSIAACAALSLSTPALAGSNRSDLPKEVAAMHCLVGTWNGSVKARMGDQTVELDVTIACEEASGGHAVACKSRFVGLPSGPAEETDLFGYDASTKTYHWYAVTNMGETHDHVAKVSNSPTVNWVYRGKQGGKAFVEKVDMTFNKDSTRITFANRTTIGGAEVFSMKGAVTKK